MGVLRTINAELERLAAKGELRHNELLTITHKGRKFPPFMPGDFAIAMLRKDYIVSHPEMAHKLPYSLADVSQKAVLLQ